MDNKTFCVNMLPTSLKAIAACYFDLFKKNLKHIYMKILISCKNIIRKCVHFQQDLYPTK